MIGELGLYCFIVLVLTGVYLTFFFDPSQPRSIYTGSYEPLRGVEMTEAYRSALELSFDVRAGLVMRQIHHWAALLFLASIAVHLARVFFTGAFRRPRELNWIIGCTLLILATAQRAVRLLAARRPALGHRAAHRLLDHAVDPAGRHVAGLAALRRRVPGARHHRAALRHPHPAGAGGHRRAAHRPPGILVRQKHTQFPGPAGARTTWSASGCGPPTRPRRSGCSS